MDDKKINKISATEQQLNDLFKETLDGIRDDITEATENVQMYMDAILNDAGGKEMYGSFYNDALKIKGMTRDKQLKFLAMFKERVTTKEKIELDSEAKRGEAGGLPTHAELNKFIQNMEKDNKLEKPQIIPKSIQENAPEGEQKKKITPLRKEEEPEEFEPADDDEDVYIFDNDEPE